MSVSKIFIQVAVIFLAHAYLPVKGSALEYLSGDAVVVERSDIPTVVDNENATGVTDNSDIGSTGRPIIGTVRACTTPDGTRGVPKYLRDCYPVLFYPDVFSTRFVVANEELASFLVDISGVVEGGSDDKNPMICCSPPVPSALEEVVKVVKDESAAQCSSKGAPPPENSDSAQNKVIEKVVGGREAAPAEFPWIVALMRLRDGKRRQFCGGSVIDERTILTAAHCVQGIKPSALKNMFVQIGDHDIYDEMDVPHVDRQVAKIIYHKDYSSKTIQNDVAVLHLSEPIAYADNIKPVCLTRGIPPYDDGNTTADLAGWGQLYETGPQPKALRTVDVPVQTNEDCKASYDTLPSFFVPKVTDNMVCAGSRSPLKDACRGDSGGPLTVQRTQEGDGTEFSEQIGIVSWGVGCGAYPAVYTRVDKYLDWINENRAPK